VLRLELWNFNSLGADTLVAEWAAALGDLRRDLKLRPNRRPRSHACAMLRPAGSGDDPRVERERAATLHIALRFESVEAAGLNVADGTPLGAAAALAGAQGELRVQLLQADDLPAAASAPRPAWFTRVVVGPRAALEGSLLQRVSRLRSDAAEDLAALALPPHKLEKLAQAAAPAGSVELRESAVVRDSASPAWPHDDGAFFFRSKVLPHSPFPLSPSLSLSLPLSPSLSLSLPLSRPLHTHSLSPPPPAAPGRRARATAGAGTRDSGWRAQEWTDLVVVAQVWSDGGHFGSDECVGARCVALASLTASHGGGRFVSSAETVRPARPPPPAPQRPPLSV